MIHLRYTARQGGTELRTAATEAIKTLIGETQKFDLANLFSLKHDFPSEWYQFTTGNQNFTATVKKDYFPYFIQGKEITISAVELYAIQGKELHGEVAAGLDLKELSKKLNEEGKLVLVLKEDAVVTRKKDSRVFVLLKYQAV